MGWRILGVIVPRFDAPGGGCVSHGDIECHLAGVKEPELMREVAIARLTAPGSEGIHPCS